MKKMIIGLVAVAMAIATQAAQVDWKVAADSWSKSDGSAAAAGTTVYLIDYSQKDAILSALSAEGFEFTQAKISAISGVISSATAGAGGSVAQSQAVTPSSYVLNGTKYNWGYMVIEETSTEVLAGIAGSVSKAIYQPGHDTYGTTQVASFNNRQVMSYSTVANVPEPTSGLMLILGVAGLALRRRRA